MGGRTGGQEMEEGRLRNMYENVIVTAITLYANFRKLIKKILRHLVFKELVYSLTTSLGFTGWWLHITLIPGLGGRSR